MVDHVSRDRGSVAIPAQIRAGITAELSISIPDYLAADEWAVTVNLQGATNYSVNLTDDGTGLWSGAFVAGTTSAWAVGDYRLYVIASNSPDKHIVTEGEFRILANPTAVASPSGLQAQLVAVDVAIAAVLAGKGVKSYQIDTIAGKRQLERMSLEELRAHRQWLKREINAELEATGQRKRTAWRPIGTRFTR